MRSTIKKKIKNKKYRETRKDKIIESNKKWYNDKGKLWYEANKSRINENRKKLYYENPDKRIISNCRDRVRCIFKGTKYKNKSSIKYIGCTREFLLKWFNFQLGFSHDMNFDNYGLYWHIDHVIPCAKWDLSKENHQQKCFHWTNLSPLVAQKNLSKHDNIDLELINEQNNEIEQFSKLNNEEYFKLDLPN